MNTSQPPPRSWFRRIFSLEGALAAFGLFSLGSGLRHGSLMPVFWGVIILVGLVILTAVRRRDWKSHWEALETQRPSPPPGDDPGPPPA